MTTTNLDVKNASQVIDKLLDDLAVRAESAETSDRDFFDQVVRSIETFFSPTSTAILALGPNGEGLYINGSSSIAGSAAVSDKYRHSKIAHFISDESNDLKASLIESDLRKWAVCKVVDNQKTWGGIVVEFDASANVNPLLPILDALGEITSQFVRSRSQLRSEAFLQRFLQFSYNSHSSLEPKLVASHLANDARLLFNCERLWIFQMRSSRAKLLAVSSVSGIENRSRLAKRVSRMVNAAVRERTTLFSDQPPESAKVRNALDSFQELSTFPFLFGIPLQQNASDPKSRSKPIGFLIAESENDINRFEFTRGLQLAVPHMGLALSNARKVSQIPFRKILSLFGSLKSLLGMLTAAAIVAALIGCLLFLKSDFKVRVNGELRPVIERIVFAPTDGFVESVSVNHGDEVSEGQIIAELSSPTLTLELEELAGDQLKTDKLLETKRIALNQAASGNMGDQATLGRLASEIAELEQELIALADRKKFLQERVKELVIYSPIDGRVTTWQLKRNILKKPVQWGEEIAKVADEKGNWKLNFQVPEDKIGYLLQARKESTSPLEIEFFFDSNPSTKRKTKIVEVANLTELDPEFGPSVTVICDFDEDEHSNFVKRHGARVVADFNCGKRTVFSTWTQQLFDSIRRRIVW